MDFNKEKHKILHLGWITLSISTGWKPTGSVRAPRERTWGLQWMPSSVWANSMSSLQTGQTTYWTMFIRMNAATDQGKLLPSSTWHSEAVQNPLSSFGLPGSQERVQHTAAQIDRAYEKNWKEPGLFCLTKRRSRENPTAAYNHLKESKTRELNFL